MIFDIHTKEAAQGTLQELTGIAPEKCESYLHEEDRYTCRDDFVINMLRKFYKDHTVCGFLSTRDALVYEGRVHKRPEILMDIDALLGTQLALEWERSHSAYKVIARVNGHDICYVYEDEQSEEEKIMAYIVMAYNAAFRGGDENIVLMKDGVQIPACDILTIESFQEWN